MSAVTKQHAALTTGIEQLRTQFSGSLIAPGDPGYDAARAVWNGMIDKHPALIARCTGVADVAAAVNFARAQRLVVAVRGGGHNVAGLATCDDGIVIDLSPMKEVRVDAEMRVAYVQGGATWGNMDAATQRFGLAAPGGVFSETGVAGLTLGGGYGWLRGSYGLACDNLIAAEVVTADGRIVRADAQHNFDLLWGLRGGGGNFGIVTTFSYRLHPVGPDVMLVFVIHDGAGEKMKQGLEHYRRFCANAPDEASTIAVCGQVPPEPAYPAELHRRPFILFGGLYAGNPQEGERVLQPLRDFGTPLLDFSGVRPYVEAQRAWDADYPTGRRYYWKSANLMSLGDDAIACIAEHAHCQPSPFSTIDLWHIGGAVKRVGPDTSAFHGRQAAFMVSPEAGWEDNAEDQANIDWVRACIADIEQFSDGSRYLNFAGLYEEGDEMMQQSFGAQYERLARLKAKYDPANLFGLNQNIKPAAGNGEEGGASRRDNLGGHL
jgi:FAD/FMN-containing dehydrogenase